MLLRVFRWLRPRHAVLTAIIPGRPPIACVTLRGRPAAAPLIVDIIVDDRVLGSATLAPGEWLAEIPLSGWRGEWPRATIRR
jgi:hypothetical protein